MEDREKRRREFSCFSLPLPPLAVFKDLRYEDGWDGKRGEVGRDENLTMGAGDKVGGRQRSFSHRWARSRELGGVSTKICPGGGWFLDPPEGEKLGFQGRIKVGKVFLRPSLAAKKYDFWRKMAKKFRGGWVGYSTPSSPPPCPPTATVIRPLTVGQLRL